MRVRRNRVVASLVLATLLVGGQLASLAHFAATPHIECSDDGELIHVSTLAASAPAQSTIERDPSIPDRPHRHEHCQIVSMRRAPLLRAWKSPSAVLRPCTRYVRTCIALWRPRRPAIAILRLAPKSSPPALEL
jgi:hypothetical protein